MAVLALKLTDAGLAAVQGAAGSDPVTLSHLGLTTTPFDYAPTLITLPGEFKRLPVTSGMAAAPNITHLTVYDTSDEAWSATGLGIYMEDGALFAVYTSDEPIQSKSSLAFALLVFDIAFQADVAENIEFGNAVFAYPPATEEGRGVARIAPQSRVDASEDGEDDAQTIVTPKTLRKRMTAILAAIDAEVDARVAGDDALEALLPPIVAETTAAAILAKLIGVDGHGSLLDADLLDGFHGSSYDRIVESSLTEIGGYEVYASGKKTTWTTFQVAENSVVTFNLPTPHNAWVNPSLGISSVQGNTSIQDNTGISAILRDGNGAPIALQIWNADDRTVTVWIRTIGV
ncbi:hypothetical protein NRB_26300 [Novosphingobium sp. 11B]